MFWRFERELKDPQAVCDCEYHFFHSKLDPEGIECQRTIEWTRQALAGPGLETAIAEAWRSSGLKLAEWADLIDQIGFAPPIEGEGLQLAVELKGKRGGVVLQQAPMAGDWVDARMKYLAGRVIPGWNKLFACAPGLQLDKRPILAHPVFLASPLDFQARSYYGKGDYESARSSDMTLWPRERCAFELAWMQLPMQEGEQMFLLADPAGALYLHMDEETPDPCELDIEPEALLDQFLGDAFSLKRIHKFIKPGGRRIPSVRISDGLREKFSKLQRAEQIRVALRAFAECSDRDEEEPVWKSFLEITRKAGEAMAGRTEIPPKLIELAEQTAKRWEELKVRRLDRGYYMCKFVTLLRASSDPTAEIPFPDLGLTFEATGKSIVDVVRAAM